MNGDYILVVQQIKYQEYFMPTRESNELDDLIRFFNTIKNNPMIKYIILAVAALVFLLFLNPFVVIGAGERGVVLNFGAVQEHVLDEGIHFRIPVVQQIIKMDVKIQKARTDSEASTKDLQITKFSIVLNYHISPDTVNWIYQNIGTQFGERIIEPSVQEGVKAIAARYTAEELITQRDKVSLEIKELLSKRLLSYRIAIDDFSIVSFTFSSAFTDAIEQKQTAEQNALKALRDLDRIKIEAQQTIEQARAEATALRLKRSEITTNLLQLQQIQAQLKAIEKWNGVLPNVTSGAVPFLNIEGKK
jgi:regulator of protease activity HflC (stomatin/prohibitin superfamily)